MVKLRWGHCIIAIMTCGCSAVEAITPNGLWPRSYQCQAWSCFRFLATFCLLCYHQWSQVSRNAMAYRNIHDENKPTHSRPDVIGSPDTTFARSRNGLSALVWSLWWTFISTHTYEQQLESVLDCLIMKLAEYTEAELKKVEKEIGRDIWIAWTPLALSLRFRKPNDAIVYKYTLASEEFYYGNELHHYTHIYMMKGITKKKIDSLLEELQVLSLKMNLQRPWKHPWILESHSLHAVAILKWWVSTATWNLQRGLTVTKEDAGIVKGTRPLMSWPQHGREFK